MALASVLFFVDGILDGAYPGGGSWFGEPLHYGIGWISYVFAVANAAIAVFIARGSEGTLVARIGLSLFFLIERPVTAVALGPKTSAAIAIHGATAVVELVILLGAVRVWQLGRSVSSLGVDEAFDLDAPSPVVIDAEDDAPPSTGIGSRTSWVIGLLTLVLAGILVADGIAAGFIPGGRVWGLAGDQTGWLVYLFAIVALSAAVPAVHGRTLGLRVLLALALIFFVERALTPFVLSLRDVTGLALHLLGAFAALAVALAAAGAIRGAGGRRHERSASPQAA